MAVPTGFSCENRTKTTIFRVERAAFSRMSREVHPLAPKRTPAKFIFGSLIGFNLIFSALMRLRNEAMRFAVYWLAALLLVWVPRCLADDDSHALDETKQLVLVTSGGWTNVTARLTRFERMSSSSPWRQVGKTIPAVVGRNGLAWGRGLHSQLPSADPIKREGDGKSPAGIFRLTTAFGLTPREQMKPLKVPYLPLTDVVECVYDTNSVYYNSIVQRDSVAKVDWNSSEKMKAIGEQYRLGVFVEHNRNPVKAAGGSCIFMHIWKTSDTGTSGCTAMAPGNIGEFISWLDASKQPVLVQLPNNAFQRLKKPWNLPEPK